MDIRCTVFDSCKRKSRGNRLRLTASNAKRRVFKETSINLNMSSRKRSKSCRARKMISRNLNWISKSRQTWPLTSGCDINSILFSNFLILHVYLVLLLAYKYRPRWTSKQSKKMCWRSNFIIWKKDSRSKMSSATYYQRISIWRSKSSRFTP